MRKDIPGGCVWSSARDLQMLFTRGFDRLHLFLCLYPFPFVIGQNGICLWIGCFRESRRCCGDIASGKPVPNSGIYWAENSELRQKLKNFIFIDLTEALICFINMNRIYLIMLTLKTILGRSHTYIRSDLKCYQVTDACCYFIASKEIPLYHLRGKINSCNIYNIVASQSILPWQTRGPNCYGKSF